jgi:hypothetical protein
MADLQTTIGADLSALDTDLRSAISKQEAYARRLQSIDDAIVRHAERNADRLARQSAAVDRSTRASLGGLATRANTATAALGRLGVGGVTAAAGVFAVLRTLDASSRRYGESFIFAQRQVDELGRKMAEALARVESQPGRTVSGTVGASGFRGAREAVAGRQEDLLRRIEKNTRGSISVSFG